MNYGINHQYLKSSGNIDGILDSFNKKINDFNNFGYFLQKYESSFEAINYAVYSLDTIGRIGSIDTDQVFNSVTSFYNATAGYFQR